MTTNHLVLAACGLILLATNAMAGDPERGAEHFQLCAACHGTQGEGVKELDAPRLAGLADWYLERQLRYYREGIRGNEPADVYGAPMRPMALALPDEQAVQDVIAYVQTLDAPRAESTITGDVERGAELYRTCVACHGPRGEGNQALNAPRIAGQHDWYQARQLDAYRKGLRGTHTDDLYGMQMRPMAQSIPDQQGISDLIAYINTLMDDLEE